MSVSPGVAIDREARRTHPDPRRGPGFVQSLPTLTTWREARLCLLDAYPPAETGDVLAFGRALNYVFSEQRSAVVACVRAGRVVLAAQVANEAFRNAWHGRVDWDLSARTLHPGAEPCRKRSREVEADAEADAEVEAEAQAEAQAEAGGLGAYLLAKVRSGGADERARVLREPGRWWLNGNVVCNVPAHNVWGDAFVVDVMDMIGHAFRGTAVDADLILNRRDGALLDACSPVARNIARDAEAGILSCLSFYTGPGFLDRSMPTAEDWRATNSPYPTSRRPWDDRHAVAVFRGSSTGHANPDLNVRVRLAKLSKMYPHLLDAGLTAINTRDRIVAGSASGSDDRRIVISAMPRRAVAHLTMPFMDMQTQFDTHRYVIYAPGHSAASRIGALLASGCAVVYVQDPTCRCPHTWVERNLRPVRWRPSDRRLGVAAVQPQDANVIVANAHALDDKDQPQVVQAIEWLIHNNAAAKKLRDNARALAGMMHTKQSTRRHILRDDPDHTQRGLSYMQQPGGD